MECAEVACGDGSASWNMVRVGDAWYHVDAWAAAKRYEAELREQAARGQGSDAASPEVSREWLLVGDGTLRGLDGSRVAWGLADGQDAPVAPADYDWGLPNGENEDSDKQVAMQHELVAPDGDEIGGQSKSYTNDLIADAQLMTSDTSGSVSPDSLVVSVHECDFSLSTADSIKWIPIETTTDCAAVEITITEPEDGQFDAPLSYCIYDAMSEEAHMISEKGVSLYGSYAISENDTTTLSLQKKGTYYLALFNACHINPYYYSVDSVNKQSLHLVMKTMANDSNEDNNDYKKATKLHEGSEKMFRLLGKDDVDVFKLTIPAKGEIKVGVRGEQEYFDSKIGYTIYRIVNGEMERVGDLGVSSYASFAFDEACDEVFEAPAAGTYFIEVANAHYWNPYYYSSGADNKTPLFIRYEYVRDSGAPSQEMANPAYALASVDMTLNGGTRDLLTTAKTLDVAAADTVFTLTARLENDDVTPRGFKLYQKSGETYRQISEAGSNGYFGAISYDAFTPGEVVYVSVVGENGEIAQTRQLLLKVEDSRQADVPATFSIGDGVTITFGQNAWPLSGMELSLPVTEFPILFDVSSDGKVRLGVNLDVKMEADNDPSWFEKLHDPKYIGEMLTGAQSKRLKKGLVSEKNSNFSTTVVGYAEGVVGSSKYTGMIGIKLKFAFSNEHQTAIAFVPIVIETSGGLEATGSAKATAHCESGRLVLDDASLRVGGKGSVGVYGGVGVAYLLSGGGWGDASSGLSWLFFPEAASGLEEVYVQGRLGLKALVLGKSFPLTLVDSDKHYLYKRDTSTNGL
ncbi:MAG: hypothetical protein J6D54_06150, partial [Olsenella sp.]|nr:hypothetical protein [Olsenella sp.]